jgi:uncharacterized protein YgiM (DUF1202 family)
MTLRLPMRHVRFTLPAAGVLLGMTIAPLGVSADTDLQIGGNAVIAYANGDNVRVRATPGYDGGILSEIAEGSTVRVVDGLYTAGDGSVWYQVEANGVAGYVVSDFLANSGGMLSATSGDAMTNDTVNIRSGPSAADPILATANPGQWFTLTGENINGWLSINYGDYTGYIYGAFLTQDGSGVGVEVPADPAPAPAPTGETGTRYTNDSVNLRAGAGLDQGVITILPAGVEVWLTGVQQNGFAQVSSGSGDGWIAVEYLSAEAPAAPADPAPAAPAPGGGIIWPVSGGEWSILQGYNGSSHYDSGLWQYGDSLDLVRTDGSTGGQPIYSPVNGTIRWFDPSTGGIAIDMGNGYAFAMFHAYYDGGLSEGQAISQGQYLGTISPDGEGANGGTAHLHIALWSTSDGGNWDRTSQPFVGANAISGWEFYNSGVAFEHTGTVFYP